MHFQILNLYFVLSWNVPAVIGKAHKLCLSESVNFVSNFDTLTVPTIESESGQKVARICWYSQYALVHISENIKNGN